MISHSCAKSQTAKYPVLILTRFYSLHSYILGSKTWEQKQYCTGTRTYVWRGKHGVQRFTKGRKKRTIVYGWSLLSAVATPLSFCSASFPCPHPPLICDWGLKDLTNEGLWGAPQDTYQPPSPGKYPSEVYFSPKQNRYREILHPANKCLLAQCL